MEHPTESSGKWPQKKVCEGLQGGELVEALPGERISTGDVPVLEVAGGLRVSIFKLHFMIYIGST